MKRANDILEILEIGFLIIAGATPLVILILGVLNFRRDSTRRATIVLKALVALVIWMLLIFAIFLLETFYLVAFEYDFMQGKELQSPATSAIVIWRRFSDLRFGGRGLIYWTKRQTKRMPGMGISC